MMRRGLIDYFCDGDWKIEVPREEVEEWKAEDENNPTTS
jgi:hypothetical protein